ncbi:MAG: membrane protein insertase YidC [Dysgonamonadaceae bacterium]|nr:membrane protein insertase YidC [Dysgonamonadaceae bacterium]MDD3356231.1 membrane protein insertase YidC [Dysgonamonadaceae bacterium]MDD3727607.1 membrane protein insertase YidC [Dysgonamonadaceae bacterium]MDD4246705.1 membrane protein insertase YidC [Dysgonamonadaceae bacterium]MDD4604760.1 membrane protein insertase YidC [Dysgonamonadaceae bacterium]
MDKNTIIGFLLIAAIMIVFMISQRPDAEQIAQRRIQDSIQQLESERAKLQAEETVSTAVLKEDTLKSLDSFFGEQSSITQDTTKTEVAEQSTQDSDTTTALVPTTSSRAPEEFVTIENDDIRLKVSTQGGWIYSAELKDFKRYDKDTLFLFKADEARFNLELFNKRSVRLNTESETFKPILSDNGKKLTMRLGYTDYQYIDFVYTLPQSGYLINFDIRVNGMANDLHAESLQNFRIRWDQKLRQQEKGKNFENRYATIYYKYAGMDVKKMSVTKDKTEEYSEPVHWFAYKDQFFTTTFIADKPFSNTILSIKSTNEDNYLKNYGAEIWAPVSTNEAGQLFAGFRYYLGPVHYTSMKKLNENVEKSQQLHLEQMVNLGWNWLSWINKFFVIPIFNFFLSMGWGMGLIIFLLTLLVKLIISPLTFKSYKSSAKMRVLKPQVQEIEKKYPGQDKAVERQKATMELYNKAGASPMSGCLPMLLQSPILIALFWFFPSAIELRQQSFLWADDLSTYDAIITWSGNIPLISKYLGNHLSLFCLLMTVTNIIYAKFNMDATSGGSQMAGMKYMPYMMSFMMLFFFNSYPSGLSYYYFVSTLITILLTISFRKVVNEEKLLVQLEANKRKPKKKSGFMARLEQAQKMQEQQARQRAKENAKRRR